MRRVIQLIEGDYHIAVDEAEEALVDAEWTDIYQRGGMLVRPVLEQLAAADDRATTAWRLIEVQLPYLMEMLGRVATFVVYDKRSKAWLPRNCPYSARQDDAGAPGALAGSRSCSGSSIPRNSGTMVR